jgi:cell wall assembly regulator SMI1
LLGRPIEFEPSDAEPLTESELESVERELDVELPRDYRRFLLEQNGGRTVDDWVLDTPIAHSIGGVLPCDFYSVARSGQYDMSWMLDSYGLHWLAAGVLPIAEDPGGNVICLSLRGDEYGSVYFWDHELGAHEGDLPSPQGLTVVAESFEAFVSGLRLADEVEEE